MDDRFESLLLKQHYRLHGGHGAVKLCHWMKETLLRDRCCYKQDFYGISSHRCLQMTPVVNECNQTCLFCWRVQGMDHKVDEWVEPVELLDALIEHQRKLITGFKGDPRCSLEMYEEARNPNQVAISLAGEPTMYPYLGGFIEECHSRGMTTFLVTNGTNPKVLESLDPLPTQLYVTVAAPNEEIYKRLCLPKIPDGWSRIMDTLDVLPSLDTRTVVRHTLVKGMNLGWEDDYARLDERADTTFIEPKGYVFVGDSRKRMTIENMPSHAEIVDFGSRIAERLGLVMLHEKPESRVILLGKEGTESRIT